MIQEDYLKDIYNIANANTISVLNQILIQIHEDGNARVPIHYDKVNNIYNQLLTALKDEFTTCLTNNDRHKLI
jgi:hypothetical protein